MTTRSSDFTSLGSGRTAACNYWSNLGSVHQVPITAVWTEAVWNMKSVHMASTGELNPRPSDLESNALSIWPYAPICVLYSTDITGKFQQYLEFLMPGLIESGRTFSIMEDITHPHDRKSPNQTQNTKVRVQWWIYKTTGNLGKLCLQATRTNWAL